MPCSIVDNWFIFLDEMTWSCAWYFFLEFVTIYKNDKVIFFGKKKSCLVVFTVSQFLLMYFEVNISTSKYLNNISRIIIENFDRCVFIVSEFENLKNYTTIDLDDRKHVGSMYIWYVYPNSSTFRTA